MNFNALEAISPIDGRYRDKCHSLSDFFSEFALIKYRVWVEIEYFIKLSEFIPEYFTQTISDVQKNALRNIYNSFSLDDAKRIKEIEGVTNHDVKAVEYFIKEKLDALELNSLKEWIHFGLTSQDINNTAIPKSLQDAWQKELSPYYQRVVAKLEELSKDWMNIPMLAKTHGQPASPTALGKEIRVFSERLKGQLALLETIPFAAKFGGATGNLNAHFVAIPEKDWEAFAIDFVNNTLGLSRTNCTTQIEPYDYAAAFFDGIKRLNTILIDFSRDIWTYISMNYFTQRIKEGEVGSSAMPHKVNPIDFENAEGNLGISNAILEHLSAKLPISRLQRDLTDSTVWRNVGVPFAHNLIACKALLKGLDKIQLNQAALDSDLENNWAVVAEAIQSVLRVKGYPNPYETLKALTRKNEKITQHSIQDFIEALEIDEETKKYLLSITPFSYTGNTKF